MIFIWRGLVSDAHWREFSKHLPFACAKRGWKGETPVCCLRILSGAIYGCAPEQQPTVAQVAPSTALQGSRRPGEDRPAGQLSYLAAHLCIARHHERGAADGYRGEPRSCRYANGREALWPSRPTLCGRNHPGNGAALWSRRQREGGSDPWKNTQHGCFSGVNT